MSNFLLSILIVVFSVTQAFAASDGINEFLNINNLLNPKTQRVFSKQYSKRITKSNDIIVIQVVDSSPDRESELIDESFFLIKNHLGKNLTRITVLWQKDEFNYGKSVSVGNVYINNYLNKKIDEKTFKSFFKILQVEPSPTNRNSIEQSIISKILNTQSYKASLSRKEADLYRVSGDSQTAMRIYLKALQENPQDEVSCYWIAKIYKENKDYDKAKEYYTKALEIDPLFKAADNELFELKNAKRN